MMTVDSPELRYRHVADMATHWRERPYRSLVDWCKSEFRLPPETGPDPGLYDLDRYPFWVEPLQAAADPETELMVLRMATQLGKTTFLQAVLAGLAFIQPAPAMLCAPDRDATRELRDKFYRACEVTPSLRHRIPPKHLRNDQLIDFGNSICHLAWSGSAQRLSGKSCRVVLVTEADRATKQTHEGAFEKIISERVKAWHNFLKIFESTPTDETSIICRLFDTTDRRHYYVPCPSCGHYQQLRVFKHTEGPYAGYGGIDGVKDSFGRWLSSDEVRDAAYYRCERGCRFESRDKPAILRRGVWCPDGQQVAKDGNLTGEPKALPRNKGYTLSSMYAPAITFGRMAAEWLDSRDDEAKWQSFTNNWLGRKYTQRTKTPKWSVLGRRLAGAHRRGTVPASAMFLTSGVDVQGDCAYWVVRAWGEGGTSWLVDWGRIDKEGVVREDGNTASIAPHLLPLDGLIITRDWPLAAVNPIGVTSMRALKVGIDCGWMTAAVHDFVRHHNSSQVLTVAGDPHAKDGLKWRFNRVDRNERTGKPYAGGLKRWAINTDFFKTDLIDRYTHPTDEAGAWFVTGASLDESATYLRQITNEGLAIVHDKTGHAKRKWVVTQPGVGNHYFDCEVYARAMAEMVVDGNWERLAERFMVKPQWNRKEELANAEDAMKLSFIPSMGKKWI